MTLEGNGDGQNVDLRPLVGLLAGTPDAVVEQLTVEAIKRHRSLVSRAEGLFQALDDETRSSKTGDEYVAYLEATIEMHAQMSAVTTLLSILGRTPKV